MRWRTLFFASLAVNLALGAAWLVRSVRHPATRGTAELEAGGSGVMKTNVVVRRQFFSWGEVESADYPTYIANLRNIGCPDQTIRDIIIADVNLLFARRQAAEVTSPEQQWWRSYPDVAVVRAAAEKVRALNEERRALLTRLLGPKWESGDLASLPRPSHPGVALDGPVLGTMPTEAKQAVQDISSRAQDRLQAYLEAQRLQGKNPDPAELAKLRQQTRDDLARVLTPPQVEEYLLRYSQDANNLRTELGRLKYFDATPDEFRALFRATDSIDQQLEALAGSNDPNSVAQRNSLLQQRDSARKLALGAGRYQEFQQLQDPLYRDAFAQAQQAGDPDAVETLYQINLATAQQQAAIRANTNFTAEQKAIELKRAELEQLQANALAKGQELPPEPAAAPPAPPPPPALVPPTHSYVLGAGESPSSVAMRYGLSLGALKTANPGLDLSKLKPGDPILIPGPGLTPSSADQPPP